MNTVSIIKLILPFFMIFFSDALSQDYNPCRDRRFVSLLKKDLDDMSDREYNYFIKKEEDCSEYKKKKKKKKKKPTKSRKRVSTKKKAKKNQIIKPLKETTFLPGIYFSSPLIRLQMTSKYENVSISGLKLETPISINLGKLNPYLVFEYRSYIFSYSEKEKKEIFGDFGGKALLVGLKIPMEIFKIKPEISMMTGKFHFTRGVLICLDLPQKISSNSPLKIKYSLRTNIIQTSAKSGTGWVDFGLSFGYTLNKEIISSIRDLF